MRGCARSDKPSAGMEERRWTVSGGLGGRLTPRNRPSSRGEPSSPVAAGGGAALRFDAQQDRAAPAAEAARAAAPPATANTSLATLGVDERANVKRLLERVGLQKFYEPLLQRLESVDGELESPEEAAEAIESGLLREIGMRLFEAARFIRLQKEGGVVPTPLAMRMRDGQIVANATEFLFASKLSRYSAELLTGAGLQLEDLRHVTDEELVEAGIDKEFHRKRFLREARNLGVPDTAGVLEEQSLDSVEHELDLSDEPPKPELTSELDMAREASPAEPVAHQKFDASAPEPEPEPQPEPQPDLEHDGRDQLERTGSAELQEFWSHCEPQARETGHGKSASDAQLYRMLSRTVADAPKDDSIFIRRFKINKHHPLGRGAFGVVLSARDRMHRRVCSRSRVLTFWSMCCLMRACSSFGVVQDVAIKEVMPGRRKKRLGPWEIKQLVREARAASSVRHVNVMQCYAYHRGAMDKRFFLVMELLQGPNLEQVLSTPLSAVHVPI